MPVAIPPAKSSFDTFGGAKNNYSDVVDPTTDRDASEVNAMAAACSMLTRTNIKAYVRFAGHATAPVVDIHEAVWGNSVLVIPTLVHTSTGVYTITYPSTITDPLAQVQSVVFYDGWSKVNTGATFSAVSVANNVVTVRTYNSAGSLNDLVGTSITVYLV